MSVPSKCTSESFRSIFDGNEYFLAYSHVPDTFSLEIASPGRIPLLRKTFTPKDKDAIVALSSGFLSTPFEVYDVIKDSLNGNQNWKGTLTLDATKKTLTYKCKPFTKQIEMVINVEESSPTDREKLDSLIPSLRNSGSYSTLTPQFNPLRSEFAYSDDGKVITKTSPNGWVGTMAKEKLYPTGLQRFSVKILSMTNYQIMVGITVGTTDLAAGAFSKNTSWMFHPNNGNLYSSSDIGYYRFQVKPEAGDVITTLVDMEKRTVSFELNGVSLGPGIRFNVTNEQLLNLRPVVDLHHTGNSAAFEW